MGWALWLSPNGLVGDPFTVVGLDMGRRREQELSRKSWAEGGFADEFGFLSYFSFLVTVLTMGVRAGRGLRWVLLGGNGQKQLLAKLKHIHQGGSHGGRRADALCVFPGSSPVHWRSHAVPIGAAGASGVVGVRVGDGPGDGRAEGRWLRGETHGMMHATVSTSFMSFSPATFAASRL